LRSSATITSGGAAIGNDLEIEPGRGFEQLGRQILGAADIDGADIELARLRARRRHEVGHGPELGIDVAREYQCEIADGRDGGEVLQRVERQRVVDGGADRGAVGDEPDRIAVGGLGEHRARRRDAAGAGLIFHYEPLAELVAELLGGDPRGDVGDAGGAEGQDEPHRTDGIMRLRAREDRREPRRRGRERGGKLSSGDAVLDHVDVPFDFLSSVVPAQTHMRQVKTSRLSSSA